MHLMNRVRCSSDPTDEVIFMSFFQRINEQFQQATFCVASPKGEGFVDKEECPCRVKGKVDCESFHQKELFIKRYRELDAEGLDRRAILAQIKSEIKGKEHLWYANNVRP